MTDSIYTKPMTDLDYQIVAGILTKKTPDIHSFENLDDALCFRTVQPDLAEQFADKLFLWAENKEINPSLRNLAIRSLEKLMLSAPDIANSARLQKLSALSETDSVLSESACEASSKMRQILSGNESRPVRGKTPHAQNSTSSLSL